MRLHGARVDEYVKFRAGDRGICSQDIVWQRVENGVPANPRVRKGDALKKAEEMLSRRAVKPVITNVELPPEQLVGLPGGIYETPFFGVSLDRGCSLFPLTKKFLHEFSANDAVREIMGRVDGSNAHFGSPAEMAGYLGIYDALNLAAIINRSLTGGVRLIVPPEPVIAAFFSIPELAVKCKGAAFAVTASYFDKGEGKIAYFSGYTDPETGQYHLSRHGLPANTVWNSGVIFQVTSTLAPLPYLPR